MTPASEPECEACRPIIQAYEATGKKWAPTPVGGRVHAAHHAEIASLRKALSHLVNHCEQVTILPNAKCLTITEARRALEGTNASATRVRAHDPSRSSQTEDENP